MLHSISDERNTMAGLNCGNAPLKDNVFVSDFEGLRFPPEQFRHADHIRLAWIYLRQYDYTVAEERMRRGIHRFACHVGATHKYHATITIAWMRLVSVAFQLSSRIDDFGAFVHAHAWLLNKDTLFEFYSRALLMSDAARASWVEPDLKPIPMPPIDVRQSETQAAIL